MHISSDRRAVRPGLVSSISALLLGTSLIAGMASAQTVLVQTSGQRAGISDQRAEDAEVTSRVLPTTPVLAADALYGSHLTLAINLLHARAIANSHEGVALGGVAIASAVSRISIRGDRIDADGDTVLAASQAVRGSAVHANVAQSGLSARLGAVERSTVSIADNVLRADARANDQLARVTLTGSGGAAIASLQSVDTDSGMRASLSGIVSQRANTLSLSSINVVNTTQQAVAGGNAADLLMIADGPSDPGAAAEPGASDVGETALAAQAGRVVGSRQTSSGSIAAAAGETGSPVGTRLVIGSMIDSGAIIEGNRRSALATGNDVLARIGATAPAAGSAVLVIGQEHNGTVLATSTALDRARFEGQVEASAIMIAQNQAEASATGNAADTRLHLAGASRIAGPEADLAGSGAGQEPIRATSAPVAIQVDQRAGAGVIAARVNDAAVALQFEGGIEASRVEVSGNLIRAAGTANDALAQVAIEAGRFADRAELLSVQDSDADLRASVGSGSSPAGVNVIVGPWLSESQVLVSGNANVAEATANRAANRLQLDAGSAAGGAATSLTLTSIQRTGGPDGVPTIESMAVGGFSVAGNAELKRDTIRIANNAQQATTIANSATNALSLAFADGGTARSAITASQSGAAALVSDSTLRLAAPAMAKRSVVELADNSNLAAATINLAENRLAIAGHFDVDGAPGSDAVNSGGHRLSSVQDAAGSATARATTSLTGTGDAAQPGLSGGTFSVRSNATLAEANGNRALNLADLGRASPGGLASSQTNAALVGAYATVSVGLDDPAVWSGVLNGGLAIEGNSAVSVARGNVAGNHVAIDGAVGSASGGTVPGAIVTGVAPTLLNTQTNQGRVTASASANAEGGVLNGALPGVEGSVLHLVGNSLQASASGNVADNRIVGAGPAGAALLVSRQTNQAPILAQVAGGFGAYGASSLHASSVTLGSNSLTATAIGNLATNMIGGSR